MKAPRVIVIRNDFHNTSYRLRVTGYGALTPEQVGRCRPALCGITDCSCGGALSERGPQDVTIEYGSNGAVILVREARP